MARSGSDAVKQGKRKRRPRPEIDDFEAIGPLADEAPIGYCVACGCSEFNPCITAAGPCAWLAYPRSSGRGICTACAPRYPKPLATFAQVDALLSPRGRR